MDVDTRFGGGLATAAEEARAAEAQGFGAIWSTDDAHDPFLPLLPAANATERIQVGSGVAVAFARSPMTVAQTAWDLQATSGGRMLLGLGSQVGSHIQRRFSMPWSQPAARMREYICALRAIWASWQNGSALNFAGDFYTHTLMPPFFNPGPVAAGEPPVYLAAVGDAMTRVAAEVADGLLLHRFTTARYLHEVTLPAVRDGSSARGATLGPLQVVLPAFTVAGDTEAEIVAASAATRSQIAFYASTPAYRRVLQIHGWGDLQPELQEMTRQGRWAEMSQLVDDDMLSQFAVIGTPEECGRALHDRFAAGIDRIAPTALYAGRPEILPRVARAIRRAARS